MNIKQQQGFSQSLHILFSAGLIIILIGLMLFISGNGVAKDRDISAIENFACPINSWVATSNSAVPSARADHTAVWTGTEMIVWGGYAYTYFNTGGKYNPVSNSWSPVPTSGAPTARSQHIAGWTGTVMVVWGGWNGGTFFDTGGEYNPTTNSWTDTPALNKPSGRTQHSVVWTGTELIIWGGFNGSAYLNTGAKYNPSTHVWTAMSRRECLDCI